MKRIISGIGKHYYAINKVFLFLVVLVILVNLFPREGKFKYEFQKGKPWPHEDIIAPFDFAILKSDEELRRDRKSALDETFAYFRYSEEVTAEALESFKIHLSKEWYSRMNTDPGNSQLFNQCLNTGLSLLDSVLSTGVIDTKNFSPETRIVVLKQNLAEISTPGQYYSLDRANSLIKDLLRRKPVAGCDFLLALLQESLVYTIQYDDQLTRKQRELALQSVSLTRGMIQTGEKLMSKGEIVNDEKFQVLTSFSQEYQRKLGISSNFRLITVGRVILVALSLLVFALFMYTFRRDIFSQNRNIVLLLLLITLMVTFTTLVIRYNINYLNAVPLCLVPIMVRAFYDTRLALFVHIITIVILGFLVPNSFEFLFMQLITGIIAIISVVHLYRRSQFFVAVLYIFLSYSFIYIGINLMQEGSTAGIRLGNFLLFGVSAMLILFSYPLIFIFERIFGLITDVSLIEYSDSNSGILREMAAKAPGTYQHSLVVSNIAEEAARAINANVLLARTGALYHDLGKMEMPGYFIENQHGDNSPHDELSSEESARIIIGHVLNGVSYAKKRKLPEVLIDFIRTHHGTRLTQYFYTKYKAERGEEEIEEDKFRYSGPVPFSKETSIVMMADSVEAASRVMKAPTAEKIDNLVERIINDQMDNKQFNNSELTIKDITTIKKIIKKKLLSIYHLRVEYPVSNG